MNLQDYIAKAKRILREDAGSEGFLYLLKYKGELKEEGFVVEEKTTDKEDKCAKIRFEYPRDCGLAAQELKDLGIEVVSLEILY
jgi:GTP cyclohydrolase II